MNWNKTISHLVNSSDEDFDIAKYLMDGKRIIQSLFFCHLSIEKLLKAYFIRQNSDLYPYTHNLKLLADKSNLELNKNHAMLISLISKYQMEGRYPDADYPRINFSAANNLLNDTKIFCEWLKKKL